MTIRVRRIAAGLVVVPVVGFVLLNLPRIVLPTPAKTFKSEWHPSCQVMAWSVPSRFSKPLQYSKDAEVNGSLDTLGECVTTKRPDGLWHVVGTYYNQRMVTDRLAPIPYEGLMIEDNDIRDLAVKHYGTQYLVCSVAVDGVDRTGGVRLKATLKKSTNPPSRALMEV